MEEELSGFTASDMEPLRVLLPLQSADGGLEAFDIVNALAGVQLVTAVLLRVVNLDLPRWARHAYAEAANDAQKDLERLAYRWLHPRASPRIHVRFGRLIDEILAEIKTEEIDFVVLPTDRPVPQKGIPLFNRPKRPIGTLPVLASKMIQRRPELEPVFVDGQRGGRASTVCLLTPRAPTQMRAPWAWVCETRAS